MPPEFSPRRWMFPEGDTSELQVALVEHRVRDRESLRALTRSERGAVWELLGQALDARPALYGQLLSCGGLHLATGGTPKQIQRVTNSICGNVAELSAMAGLTSSLTVEEEEPITFPASGLIYWPSVSPVEIRTRLNEMTVTSLARTTTLIHNSSPASSDAFDVVRSDEPSAWAKLPRSRDFRLDQTALATLIDYPSSFELSSVDEAATDVPVLHQTLAILRSRCPELYTEMQALPLWISVLRKGGRRLSFTSDGLPTTVFLNLPDPLEALDLLVHEYHHLKLDLLSEHVTLMEDPDAPVPAPWRPDMRSSSGVFHGIYVFSNVAYTFNSVLRERQLSPQGQRRQAVWRVAVLQAAEALRSSNAGLTPFGHELLLGLEKAADRWLKSAGHSYGESISWADEVVRVHQERVSQGLASEPSFMTG